MDRTERMTGRAAEDRGLLARLIERAKRRAPLLIIMMLTAGVLPLLVVVNSLVGGEPVRAAGALVLVLLLGCLMFAALEIVLPALTDWWGFDAWLARQRSKNFERKLSALTDAQKAPFQMEHRCKLSPAEEIWVRHERDPHPTRGTGLSLEVLYSKNSGQTWEKLPLQLSPWARFKCSMLDGEWPPTSPSRNLSCVKDGISFEVIGADYWDTWPNVWRATYRPRWKWWTLRVIGPLWVEAFFQAHHHPLTGSFSGHWDRTAELARIVGLWSLRRATRSKHRTAELGIRTVPALGRVGSQNSVTLTVPKPFSYPGKMALRRHWGPPIGHPGHPKNIAIELADQYFL